jgi:ATP-dependent DNA ligase
MESRLGVSLRDDLEEWLRFIKAESHILKAHPLMLFQQAANQPDEGVVAKAALAVRQGGSDPRQWFRWVNKPQQRDPCILTMASQSAGKDWCAYLPGSKRILSDGFMIWAQTGQSTLPPHTCLC